MALLLAVIARHLIRCAEHGSITTVAQDPVGCGNCSQAQRFSSPRRWGPSTTSTGTQDGR